MMAQIRVPNYETGADWVIDGEQIAVVNSRWGSQDEPRRTPRPRWGEYFIWKLDSGRYGLYRASFSVIYHTEHTSCRMNGPGGRGTGGQMGKPATVEDLPDDAEPCPDCRPPYPDELGDKEPIRFEFPRQGLVVIRTPEEVIDTLGRFRRQTGEEVFELSGPSQELIRQCRDNDPAFRATNMPVTRIG